MSAQTAVGPSKTIGQSASLLQQIASRETIPPMPLDLLVAETQGQLGYLLQQELGAALDRRGIDWTIATLVTQVEVDPADEAFLRPTKPIGPHLSREEAAALRSDGVSIVEVPGGAWRRVVASPRPKRLLESEALRSLVAGGVVVIAAGGGGIPVVRDGLAYRGVEGVVDKDLTAAILADEVRADVLLILTDVDRVVLDRGTRRERAVSRLSVSEAEAALNDGQFPAGSMGPKIEAAMRAVAAGRRGIIASLGAAAAAVEGGAGTEIVP